MGRLPKDEFSVRSKSLRLRLTREEHAWIKTIAEEHNKSMREVLWESFQKDIHKMPTDDFAKLNAKVVEEVKHNKVRR